MGRLGEAEYILIFLVLFGIWFIIKSPSEKNKENRESEFGKAVTNSEKIISHNIVKAQKYVEKKISLSYLTSCNWVLQNNDLNIQYTFRNNGDLLIVTNGIVQKCIYELIVDNNSILITKNNITELYNIINEENDFLYLNRVSNNEILMFINHTKIKDEIKKFIKNKY